MNYCSNCGNKLPEGVGYSVHVCPVCGMPLDGFSVPAPAPAKNGSDLGLISMILSIVSFIVFRVPLSITALVLSLNEKKKNGGVFTKYGKVGFICSLVSLGIVALVLLYFAYQIIVEIIMMLILGIGAASM